MLVWSTRNMQKTLKTPQEQSGIHLKHQRPSWKITDSAWMCRNQEANPSSTIFSGVQADMSKEAEVAQLVRHTLEHFSGLDIFVNNAAQFVFGHATEVTEEGAALLSNFMLLMYSTYTQ
jgi:NAD(P)-dependent dehydrogenase (short-subunit alcohol dehydrogenase family)